MQEWTTLEQGTYHSLRPNVVLISKIVSTVAMTIFSQRGGDSINDDNNHFYRQSIRDLKPKLSVSRSTVPKNESFVQFLTMGIKTNLLLPRRKRTRSPLLFWLVLKIILLVTSPLEQNAWDLNSAKTLDSIHSCIAVHNLSQYFNL